MIDEMREDRAEQSVGTMPEGMDPERYADFPDADEDDEWLGFGSQSSGGVF